MATTTKKDQTFLKMSSTPSGKLRAESKEETKDTSEIRLAKTVMASWADVTDSDDESSGGLPKPESKEGESEDRLALPRPSPRKGISVSTELCPIIPNTFILENSARWVIRSPPSSTLKNAMTGALLAGRRSKGGVNEVTICINDTGTLTSASSLIAAVFTANPTGFPDWSAFAALFDEVKLVSFQVQFVKYLDTSKTTAAPIMAAYFPSSTSVPATYSNIQDGAPLMYYPYESTEKAHILKMPVLKSIGWAPSASPVPGPYAGCPGTIKIISGPTVTGMLLGYHVKAFYRLRGRI
jgi:hypothetical protein